MPFSSTYQILTAYENAILIYFFIVNSFYAILLVSAALQTFNKVTRSRGEPLWRTLGSELTPKISILAPAYGEEATIIESTHSLLTLSYPSVEIVVINDGSLDSTLNVLIEEFRMERVPVVMNDAVESELVRDTYRSPNYPNLLVIDKANGGKADALNAGLNAATGELICAIDADTIIEPDSLQRMVKPFIEDDSTLASGGTIRAVNDCTITGGRATNIKAPRRPIPGFQAVEYARAFLFGRMGWNSIGGNLIISGAFGMFRREAMLAVGGYTKDTVGEDMEIVISLRVMARKNGLRERVVFIPDPVAWTEVPEDLTTLGNQRDRWHRGLADVLWRYKRLMFRPKYGAFGMVAFPYFVLVELAAPVLEFIGLVTTVLALTTGSINIEFAVLFLLVAYAYGLVLTYATLLIGEMTYFRHSSMRDVFLLLAWAAIENFGYRQLTVYWRLRGLYKYLTGSKSWGTMKRRGFKS